MVGLLVVLFVPLSLSLLALPGRSRFSRVTLRYCSVGLHTGTTQYVCSSIQASHVLVDALFACGCLSFSVVHERNYSGPSGKPSPRRQGERYLHIYLVQWSEDVIKADPFFGRSRVRFRVPPWVSNTIARDHLA